MNSVKPSFVILATGLRNSAATFPAIGSLCLPIPTQQEQRLTIYRIPKCAQQVRTLKCLAFPYFKRYVPVFSNPALASPACSVLTKALKCCEACLRDFRSAISSSSSLSESAVNQLVKYPADALAFVWQAQLFQHRLSTTLSRKSPGK